MLLKNEDKVKILLQQEEIAVSQMSQIKNDEMLWLKIFFIFYGAILGWILSYLLKPLIYDFNNIKINSFENILYATPIFSFFATIIFLFLFIRTRWSYYDIGQRLLHVQKLLQLYNSKVWGGSCPIQARYIIGPSMNYKNWRQQTKPYASFLTRFVFLLGANMIVTIISGTALTYLSNFIIINYLVIWIIIHFFTFLIIMFLDYIHFKNVLKKIKQRMVVS